MLKKVVVTFDIDGTLLWCINGKKIQRNAVICAFQQLFPTHEKIDIDQMKKEFTLGITDSAVIKTILKHVGYDKDQSMNQKYMNYYEKYFIQQNLEVFAQKNISRLLDEIRKIDNIQLCLATGNSKSVSAHKLRCVGLDSYFSPFIGGFGDNQTRSECILDSWRKVEKLYNCKIANTIHIGDSVADISAAHEVGAIPIGVCTGIFKKSDFLPTKDLIIDNYETGYDQIYEAILSVSKYI